MSNLLEKSVNFGLGLFVYSRDKIEEMVNELVKKGEVAKKDAYKYTAELVKKGEEQKNEIKKIVKESVSEVMSMTKKGESSLTKDDIRKIVREEMEKFKSDNKG